MIVPAELKPRSGELRLVVPQGLIGEIAPQHNEALIKAVRRAWLWKQRLLNEHGATLAKIADEEDVSDRYVASMVRLGFLAPDIVDAILDGRQPRDLELQRMLRNIPDSWREQRRRFGFDRTT